ncbi:hypothetical protein [Gordonia sp. 852002-51296_SCH5728562-b]|uniref:hypothetical protein n=1 Tax=Gordonia sp. 852002-51296_SCH5728562-b TaxID=1834101 RepID=UPI0007E9961D|nr:hypothetical protein [Gordonia sp. 852002-51296_SCH5728562-b]OBA32883.1 hypothetical protein A5766_12520 [Gordonia sp. 852002-51296_SCH5728562-b]
MSTATTTATGQRLERCEGCGTPTWRWRGSVHGYKYDECVARAIGLDRPPSERQMRTARFTRHDHHERQESR